MKLKKYYLPLIVLLLFYSGLVVGQNDPYKSVSLVPPTASSLGKYADIPVNTHTGIPTISIPIYSAKLGPLEVPISLSYHAGGLKVMEPSSWVGAGWALNAGGVITRTVKGAPDERLTSQSFADQYYGHLSGGGYAKYLWKENPDFQVNSLVVLNQIAFAGADGEPDLFFFNFNNYSGKFYFNENGKPIIVPEQDLKITYDYPAAQTSSISSFVITTPDGIKYHFGITPETDDTDPVERSLAYSSGPIPFTGDGRPIVSWYLNRIESFDGVHKITFQYEPEQYSYPTLALFSVPYSENLQQGTSYTQIFVDGVKLRKIDFKNGVVQFNPGEIRTDLNAYLPKAIIDVPNTSATALGDITITDNISSAKKYVFGYDYFRDDISPMPGIDAFISYTTDKRRLKLISLQEKALDNSVTATPHYFEYYDDFVPRRLSFSQDYWGFINGVTNPNTLIPTLSEVTNSTTGEGLKDILGADRKPYWPAMRGGTLKKIIYPTGGAAEYEFEPNNTWVSSLQWTDEYREQFAVGYGSSNETRTEMVYFNNKPYKFVLNNSNGGGLSGININYSSGQSILTLSADPGKTSVITVLMPAGLHSVTLSKNGFGGSYTANGSDVIVFEKISSNYSRAEIVGGLRIKKTVLHDGVSESNNIETNYSYDDGNGKTSGVLYSKPSFVQVLKNTGRRFLYRDDRLVINGRLRKMDFDQESPDVPYFSNGSEGRKALMSPVPLLAMSTSQGNHIGYREVRVSKVDNGYSIYRFYGSPIWDNNLSDIANRVYERVPFPEAPNYPEAPLPFEYIRGNLQYEGHFSQAGKLLKEVNYYPTYVNSNEVTHGIRVYSEWRNGLFSAITEFTLQTAKKTQEVIDEKIYDLNSNEYLSNVKTLFYGSSNHNEVTEVQMANSKNELIQTKSTYAFDYLPANCIPANSCKTTLDNFTTSSYLQLQVNLSNCPPGDVDCIRIKRAEYDLAIMAARQSYDACRLSIDNAKATCLSNASVQADPLLKPVLSLQGRNMNPVIETVSFKNGKLTGAMFYGFDFAANPSSFVYIKKKEAINLATPSASFVLSTVSNNTIIKDARYETEVEYLFDNGNLVNAKGRDGIENSFIWGYNNSLPIVKAVGANYSTLQIAYNASGGDPSLLRNQPGLSKSYISTYTHNPLLGMVSETNPNGRTVKYEYDPIFRLLRIRDHDNNILKQWEYQYYTPICSPNWQNQGQPTCEILNGVNTGYQIQLQKDIQTCSPSFNQTRTITVGYNPGACPINTSCGPATCSGPGYRCVFGTCELGIKVYTNSVQSLPGQWTCTYHYEWSDGTWSGDYTETTTYNCSTIIQ
jgi:YD repeat-containing protein